MLVRHGATEWSRSGRHTGRTDIDLTPAGRAAAHALAPLLSATTFPLVLVSPMRRSAETARLAGFDGRCEVSNDLREWDYGELRRHHDRRPSAQTCRPGPCGHAPGARRRNDRRRSPHASTGSSLEYERTTVRCRRVRTRALVAGARRALVPVLTDRTVASSRLDPASVSVLGYERETPVALASGTGCPKPSLTRIPHPNRRGDALP